jgi:hypothetical protein
MLQAMSSHEPSIGGDLGTQVPTHMEGAVYRSLFVKVGLVSVLTRATFSSAWETRVLALSSLQRQLLAFEDGYDFDSYVEFRRHSYCGSLLLSAIVFFACWTQPFMTVSICMVWWDPSSCLWFRMCKPV